MTRLPVLLAIFSAAALFPMSAFPAQISAAADAEADKCESEINLMTDDALLKYAASLTKLQAAYQKNADLENAVAVRSESNRLKTDQTLTPKAFVQEPKALRDLQVQTDSNIHDLQAQILLTHLPMLTEIKKKLTVDGNLDEALRVRDIIGRLQDKYSPAGKLNAGAQVAVNTLLQDYSSDKDRADKLYKGQRFTVSGNVAGYQQDPANDNVYNVYLTGINGTSVLQCSFSKADFDVRELKMGPPQGTVLSLTARKPRSAEEVRIFKGRTLSIEGTCTGMDTTVNLVDCTWGK